MGMAQLAHQGQRLFQPLAGCLELATMDGHDAEVAQSARDAPRVSDVARQDQRLLVERRSPGEVSAVVRAVAKVVEGAGEIALVAQLPPDGGGCLVSRHRLL